MHSEQIKSIVASTNAIVHTGDTSLESNGTRNLMSNLLLNLVKQSHKNPYFAITVFQHLLDKGFVFDSFRGEALTLFAARYGKDLAKLDEAQKEALRRVAARLFSPTRA